jgi:hypothetical protein
MPPARLREPKVPQKVIDAFEFILRTPGATLQSAAAHVGMVPRMLRFKMQRPESLRWILLFYQSRAVHDDAVRDRRVLLSKPLLPLGTWQDGGAAAQPPAERPVRSHSPSSTRSEA